MRIAVLVVAALGALAALGVGIQERLEQQDARHQAVLFEVHEALDNPAVPERTRAAAGRVVVRTHAFPWFALVGAGLGLVGGLLAFDGRRAGTVLLLLAAVGPVALAAALLPDGPVGVPGRPTPLGAATVLLNPHGEQVRLLLLAAGPGALLCLAGYLAAFVGSPRPARAAGGLAVAVLVGLLAVLYLAGLAAVVQGVLDEYLLG
jgi:hypothetical protein